MLHIKSADWLHGKVLQVEFKELMGSHLVDLQEYISQNQDFYLIQELQNDGAFKNYVIDHGVIFWSNGFDIAPEYLFFLANKDKMEYHQQFIEWGYLSA
jgi:hypothetical protein